jgi:cytochrome c-type biogenesis protein
MFREVFEYLTQAVNSAPVMAYSASLIWGILSVLLSPCHLASIPLIVAFINTQGQISTRRAFSISTCFSLGILVTIAFLGVVTSVLGRIAGDVGSLGNYVVAVVFILVGMHLWEVIPLPFSGVSSPRMKGKGHLPAFFLGLVFGIAIGPCTFAYMAPMLGVTFKIATSRAIYGASLLLVYGIGHCAVIVCAGTFTEVVQHYLNWSDSSKGTTIVKRICGALVIVGGIYLLWSA